MTNDFLTDAMLAECQRKTEAMYLVCQPVTVLQVVILLQLALRHPGLTPELRMAAEQILTDVRAYFADCPTVLTVIRIGDDPAHDVDVLTRSAHPPDDIFDQIIQRALDAAAQVNVALAEYQAGLRAMILRLDIVLEATQAWDEDDDDSNDSHT